MTQEQIKALAEEILQKHWPHDDVGSYHERDIINAMCEMYSAAQQGLDFARFLEECTTVIYGDKITLYRYEDADGVGNYILDDIYTVYKEKYGTVSAAQSKEVGMSAEQLALLFHDKYETLAPTYGYETREETRNFNPESKNGKLMIQVCREILNHFASLPIKDTAAKESYPSQDDFRVIIEGLEKSWDKISEMRKTYAGLGALEHGVKRAYFFLKELSKEHVSDQSPLK